MITESAQLKGASIKLVFGVGKTNVLNVMLYICIYTLFIYMHIYTIIQCSRLNSNHWGPTKSVLIKRCSNYEFAFYGFFNSKRYHSWLIENSFHNFFKI